MKECFVVAIFFLLSGCVTTTNLYNSCGSSQSYERLFYFLKLDRYKRDWNYYELKDRESYYYKTGRINNDPTISCFESAHSYNLIGCWDSDLIEGPYGKPSFDLRHWEGLLAISEKKFQRVVNHAQDVSSLKKIYPSWYEQTAKVTKWDVENAREMNLPAGYKVATCYREWEGERKHVVSVIFIKEQLGKTKSPANAKCCPFEVPK